MSGTGLLPFARLELIHDPSAKPAALNMAVDEILLGTLDQIPRMRIYHWERPAVSIGCFDRAEPVLKRWPGHEIVRRWTGGGIVEHGADLTFSLFVPRPLTLAMLPAAESYRFIHAAVAAALGRVGCADATFQTATTSEATTASRACFENAVMHDLLISGRKVAGGAQRRTRHGLLHQGSIQNAKTATPALGVPAWCAALAAVLPGCFGELIEARPLRSTELAAAGAVATEKYGADAWLHRF